MFDIEKNDVTEKGGGVTKMRSSMICTAQNIFRVIKKKGKYWVNRVARRITRELHTVFWEAESI